MARNDLLFRNKHDQGLTAVVPGLARYCYRLLKWTLGPESERTPSQRQALARAMLDFLRGNFGSADGLENQ